MLGTSAAACYPFVDAVECLIYYLIAEISYVTGHAEDIEEVQ